MKQKPVNAGDDEVTRAGPAIPQINFAWSNLLAISLLSNINKIVEKLMYERLYSFPTIHNCIYINQLRFRKYYSTIHAHCYPF